MKKKYKKFFKGFFVFLKWLFFGLLILTIGCLFLFFYYTKDLPRPEKFTERQMFQSTKIFDRSGKILLYEIYDEEKRTWVSLTDIPDSLKKAILAAEDADFYKHHGIDLKSIIRAILIDLKIKQFTFGASTISQQLIRSTYLNLKKTIERKTREIILTLELERRYSKDQILEWYLNQIPFGRNAYGVEAAAQAFFGKKVSDISLNEAAVLASLIKAPSFYSNKENKAALLNRRNYVLDRMCDENFLNREEAENIKKQEINFIELTHSIKAPHFVMYVRDFLIKKYGEEFLKEKGLKVYTSLDWNLQQEAEKIIREKAEKNKNKNAFNAALVAINPRNGEILTMVGSKDWFSEPEPKNCIPGKNCKFDPYTNIAISPRQPGSAFKPFIYATAFKKGYNDETIVIDEETNFGTLENPYIPQNYDGLFRGPVTLRSALAQSLNIPAIKVLNDFSGIKDSIQTAKDLGITTLNKPPSFYGLSLVLGGAEVKLLEMTSAYGVFAAKGLQIPPVSILKIEDSSGKIIEENKKVPKRILEPKIADLITDILSDNEARAPMFGINSALYIEGYNVAVKTGTTQNYKDAWTVGYTSDIATGVWVGNNNNASMRKGAGGISIAAPIWKAFMQKVLFK